MSVASLIPSRMGTMRDLSTVTSCGPRGCGYGAPAGGVTCAGRTAGARIAAAVRKSWCRIDPRPSLQIGLDEIDHVLSVDAKDAAGSNAVAVPGEGRHAGNDGAAAQVVRPTRIAETRSAGRRVVREEHRERTGES